MSNQPRVAKVLATLLLSMTVGAVVLLVIGGRPPDAGPFCLYSYYKLDPIDKAVASEAPQSASRWSCIEIYYSGTKAGNIDQLASLAGLSRPGQLNCHFVVCNGLGGRDGQIQSTNKWHKQWSISPSTSWYGTPQTIRVCIVGDGDNVIATNSQIRRVEALTEKLTRTFGIESHCIYYPGNWH